VAPLAVLGAPTVLVVRDAAATVTTVIPATGGATPARERVIAEPEAVPAAESRDKAVRAIDGEARTAGAAPVVAAADETEDGADEIATIVRTRGVIATACGAIGAARYPCAA
jgi:hypothetical protein